MPTKRYSLGRCSICLFWTNKYYKAVVNKTTLDKLALLIDEKDSNDDYDLVALLKNKYGIDLFPTETNSNGVGSQPGQTTPTLPTTTGDTETGNKTTPSTVHTRSEYGGDKTGDGMMD